MTTRFVAIGVTPGVRAAVEAAIAPVRERWPGHAWTDPLGWHVTLAFLGELGPDRVAEVAEAVGRGLATLAGDGLPRRLSVGSAASFGDRVLVAGVDDDPAGWVARGGSSVQTALAEAGLPVQRRAVRPHLTLARARRGRPVDAAVVGAAREAFAAAPHPPRWSITTVGVWSSHPRSGGPSRYVVDAEVAVP